MTLIGHSSGGGFALRVAASPIQNLFARTVLLAPYLGYDAPSSRANSGGWANPDIPRFIALSVLRGLGLAWAESLPAIAFAVPPNSNDRLTATYSYRLMRNFAARDFRADFAAATKPLAIFSGGADELIDSAKFQETVWRARQHPDHRWHQSHGHCQQSRCGVDHRRRRCDDGTELMTNINCTNARRLR